MAMGRWFSWPMLIVLSYAAASSCRAQAPGQDGTLPDTKWPVRLHILAIDDTHRTVRMQPNWASGSMPDLTGGEMSVPSGDGSQTLGGGEDDFSGAGRADVVTPADGSTAGLNFTYEGCGRVRVPRGFVGLDARWIKPGSKLEVLIPTGALTDGQARAQRCTLRVVTQPFVYLRLRNGVIVRVTQEAYSKKPSLRIFLSGGSETLQRRTPKSVESTPHPAG